MPGLGETKVVERFGPRRQLCGDAKTPVQMGTMHAPSGDDAVGPICSVDQRGVVIGADGIGAARMSRGSVARKAKILVTRKPPKPSTRARRSQRSTVGSFCTSVAVEGFSMTNITRGAALSQIRVRL